MKEARNWAQRTYFHSNPICSLPLPGPMHHFDLHHAPNVFVELIHHKVHVEEVIEIPALADHWIPKDITQSDRVDIVTLTCGEVFDVSKLNRRWDESRPQNSVGLGQFRFLG
jgi:hypothetical protein